MKRFKFEFILGSLIFIGLISLLWENLTGVHPYLGVGLFLFSVILFLGSFFLKKDDTSIEKYSTIHQNKSLLMTVVFIAIIIVSVIFLNKDRFSTTFDVTKNKINSLSSETINILKSLDKKISIVCVPSQTPGDDYCANSKDLISLYAKRSNHIENLGSLGFADQELIQKVQPSGYSRLVILTDGNRNELSGEITESKLTNGILNLIKFKKIVYFLTGHGEPSIVYAGSDDNYQDVADILRTKSYEPVEWDFKKGELPNDAQVVVLGSNRIPYESTSIQIIEKLLKNGAKLIVTLHPFRPSGLESYFQTLGLKIQDDLLILDRNNPVGKQIEKQNPINPPVLISNFSHQSPITSLIAQSFQKNAVMMVSSARSLIFDANTVTSEQYKVQGLPLMDAMLSCSVPMTPQTRVKLDPSRPIPISPTAKCSSDKTYPVVYDLGLLSTDKKQSEMIVFSFDIAGSFNKEGSINSILIPLTVAHLYKDQELVSIPNQEKAPKTFHMARNPGGYLLLFSGLLPLLTLVAGIFVWQRRRIS